MSEIPTALGDGWLLKVVGLVGTAVLGTGTWFAGRRRGQSDFIGAVQEAAKEVIEILQHECERVTAKCEKLEAKIIEENIKCDAKLAAMQSQLDAAMAGRVAGYPLIVDPGKAP